VVTRGWLVAIACVGIAIALLAARPVRTPGPLARDFEAYWAAGSAWNAQTDPYGRGIWNAERGVTGVDAGRDELLPFVGPPATLLAWSVAARWPYRRAAAVWSIVLGVSLLALVVAVLRGTGARPALFPLSGALLLGVAFAPISSDVALGQLALPAFLGATLLTVFVESTLPVATLGACIAFAQPNAALGLLSQLGRNRATLAMAFGALATYALGVDAAGWAWPIAYARVLAAHGTAERFIAIQFSPASIAYGFGASPSAAGTVGIVVAGLAIASSIAIAFRVPDRFARFAAFSALAPFVAGFFHEHDLVVAYAASLWCALRTRASIRAIALVGTLLVGIDWLGLAQRPSGIAQCVLLAIAAFAAFVALGKDAGFADVAPAGGAVAVLFAAAAILATRHPMPVWPDALVNFRAPAHAGVAAVWLAEQRASGLLAVVPAWAFLRSLSLLGCGLLAYAIYRHSTCCRTA
jgi:hypothetical protein